MPDNQGNTSVIVNALFLFLGKYLKGYRTIILAVGAMIVGCWEWITGSGLFAFLCSMSETVTFLAVTCNITETGFYSIILFVVGLLSAIMRNLTDTPVGDTGVSALSIKQVNPILLIIGGAVFMALIFIILPVLIGWLTNA